MGPTKYGFRKSPFNGICRVIIEFEIIPDVSVECMWSKNDMYVIGDVYPVVRTKNGNIPKIKGLFATKKDDGTWFVSVMGEVAARFEEVQDEKIVHP